MAAKKKTRKTPVKKLAKVRHVLPKPKGLPVLGTYLAAHKAVVGAYVNSVDGAGVDAILIPCGADKKPVILNDKEYGCFGTDIKGAGSFTDDAGNTAAMAKAGSELAKEMLKLGASLPAKHTLMAVFANLKDLFGGGWFWSSTQDDSHNAWGQDFEYGYVGYWGKYDTRKAFPIRRVSILAL